MKYFKNLSNDGYIESISVGHGQTEITQEEYNTILDVIVAHMTEDGKRYKLKLDLTWEEFDEPNLTSIVQDNEEL